MLADHVCSWITDDVDAVAQIANALSNSLVQQGTGRLSECDIALRGLEAALDQSVLQHEGLEEAYGEHSQYPFRHRTHLGLRGKCDPVSEHCVQLTQDQMVCRKGGCNTASASTHSRFERPGCISLGWPITCEHHSFLLRCRTQHPVRLATRTGFCWHPSGVPFCASYQQWQNHDASRHMRKPDWRGCGLQILGGVLLVQKRSSDAPCCSHWSTRLSFLCSRTCSKDQGPRPFGVDPAFNHLTPFFSRSAVENTDHYYNTSSESGDLATTGLPYAFFPRHLHRTDAAFPVAFEVRSWDFWGILPCAAWCGTSLHWFVCYLVFRKEVLSTLFVANMIAGRYLVCHRAERRIKGCRATYLGLAQFWIISGLVYSSNQSIFCDTALDHRSVCTHPRSR